jgi:O-antigen ligase
LLWTIAPGETLEDMPIWAFVFPLGLALIAMARWVTLTLRQMIVLVIALGLGCLWQIIGQATDFALQDIWYHSIDRGDVSRALMTNKAVASLTLFVPALLYPFWTRADDDRYRLVFGVGLGLVILMVLISFAQSAGLALLVMGLAAIVPVQSRRFWKVVRVVTVVGTLALPFTMPWLFTHVAPHLKDHDLTARAASAERLEIWSALTHKIEERPWLGYGYNAAHHISDLPIEKIYYHDTRILHPHNMLMQFWVDFGVVGALLGAAAMVAFWRMIESHRERRIRRLYFMTAAAVIATALVGWGLWQGWWVVLVFVLAAVNVMVAKTLPPKKSAAISGI